MRHPGFLLIPPLMLLDYFLTILGSKLAAQKYRQHFKFPHYEMNPVWQKSVAAGKWFNPKHLVIVSVFTLLCVPLAATRLTLDVIGEIVLNELLGLLITVFTTIIGLHLSNILTFRQMIRHPEDVSGEVVITYRHLLCLSRYRVLMVLLPLGAATCFSPSPFLIGGVAGLVALLIAISIWGRKQSGPPPPSERSGGT
jgi:hypothetical protein